ncbi:MAG: hypothetical protein R3F05_05395 [Planctomycetota bacterium]|nr:hypothetical protein [Planctomycetota bacterium]MCB9902276.1 hypothetical protein [Planctomycetota bacterium]
MSEERSLPVSTRSPRPSRAPLWIGFLAGGWVATLAFGALVWFGGLKGLSIPATPAYADDPPAFGDADGDQPADPGLLGDIFGGVTGSSGSRSRSDTPGVSNPGGGTSDSNNRAIALSASVGGGESVVYYFDTVAQRILVYQYKGRLPTSDRPLRAEDKGGLRLLAARHIDFDLRLEGYRDLSERTRNQLRSAFDAAMAKKAPKGSGIPDQDVDLGK